MEFQRHKNKDALTIEQQEGYIIALQDTINSINQDIEKYKESLKWRKKFSNEATAPNNDLIQLCPLCNKQMYPNRIGFTTIWLCPDGTKCKGKAKIKS